MKKKRTERLKGTVVWMAVFAIALSGGYSENVHAEQREDVEKETDYESEPHPVDVFEVTPEMPYEEKQYDGGGELWEELRREEWREPHEEYFEDPDQEYFEDSEWEESQEFLWSFDESEMEGADPKRADLLEENQGKTVILEKNLSDQIWIGVYPLAQYPEFPTGCEVTSLTMVLNYEGFDVTIGEIADTYLKKIEPATGSYREAFWGDPRSSESFGCFAPVIVDAANKYLEDQNSDKRAIDLTGTEFEELYEELRYGYPVLVWGSMDIDWDIVDVGCWEIDGETVVWPGNEHCMVLTGFDLENDTVRVCDPLRGIMVYDREAFEYHYIEMERQAIVIRAEEDEIPLVSPK